MLSEALLSVCRLKLGVAVLLLLNMSCLGHCQIVFVQVPQDQVVAVGSPAQFNCQITSQNPVSISWRKDGVSIVPSDRIVITSSNLVIDPTQTSDSGTYTCVVLDQITNLSQQKSATLSFASIQSTFVIDPLNTTISVGANLLLFCLHSGSFPAANITWTKNGSPLTIGGSVTTSSEILQHTNPPQTTSSLSILSTTSTDSGSYQCIATNPLLPEAPVSSNAATVIIQAQLQAPSISQDPEDIILTASGQTASFSCSGSGEPTPTFTWFHNGQAVSTSSPQIVVTTSGGTSTLSIFLVSSINTGDYFCYLSNSIGTATSNNASLHIATIEETFQLSPQDTFGVLGLTALIDCSPPYSIPPATVSWLKDSQSLPNERFTVLSNGSLQIMSVETGDAGQYVCLAMNSVLGISRNSSAVNFSVYELPVFVDSPQDVLLSTGSNFTLTCNATGLPVPQLAWYKDGVLLTASVPGSLDILSNEITVYNITLTDQGVYSCVATNAAGSSQADAAVDIITLPIFSQDPVNVVTILLTPTLLPCLVQEHNSFTYAWSFEGQDIPLPLPGYDLLENGSLLIQSVDTAHNGSYICSVNNSIVTVMGSVILKVQVSPTVTAVQEMVTGIEGQSAELSCMSTGAPAPSIMWLTSLNDSVPNSATPHVQLMDNGARLVFGPVQNSDEDVYQCIATNDLGMASDYITLLVNVAPVVSALPTFQQIEEGGSVQFSCQTTGDPIPVVAWFTSTSVNVLALGDPRIQVVDSNLVITNTTVSDAGQYTCQATNIAGSAASLVTLMVMVAPLVSLPPALSVIQGESVTIDCQSSGIPMPEISWQKDGSNLLTNQRVLINASGVVSIMGAISLDAGTYTCTAQNPVGNATASTTLNVIVVPLILVPNPTVAVNEGSTAVLDCIATGDPLPTIDWFRNLIPLPSSEFPRYSINSNNSLVITNVQTSDTGAYLCQATNIAGTETATITLKINVPPTITTITGSVTVIEGASATLACIATGDPFPSITWYANGDIIMEGTQGFQFIANGQTLVIGSVSASDEGNYVCQAISTAGAALDSLTLDVLIPPSFNTTPSPISIGIENTLHELTCMVTGDPTPQITWTLLGGVIATGNTLTFSNLQRTDAEDYTCTASNIAGSISATISLQVYYLPEISVGPMSTSVAQLSGVSFSCIVGGVPQPIIFWEFNGMAIPGAMGSTYSILSVRTNNAGTYTCVATNAVGMATANATLTVIVPPSVPTITSISASSSSSLLVLWDAPSDDGGGPITSYTIEYKPTNDTGDNFTSVTVGAGIPLTTTIDNLMVYTFYDVRITATNVAGDGDTSDNFQPPVQTHPGAPSAPVGFFLLSSTGQSVSFGWSEPATLNGDLGVYRLYLTSQTSSPVQFDYILFVEQFTVTGLNSSLTYKVEVQASTQAAMGEALWGPLAEMYIMNGVEVEAPTNQDLLPTPSTCTPAFIPTVTSTSISTITSTSITQAIVTSSVQAFVTSTTTTSTTVTETTVVSNQISIIVTSSCTPVTLPVVTLTPPAPVITTTTTSVISTVTVKTTATSLITPSSCLVSPSSSLTPTPTPISQPTLAVGGLELFALLPEEITVLWEIPSQGEQPLTGYHVYLSPSPPPPSTLSFPIILPLQSPVITIDGLATFTEYSVTVAVFNSAGEGPHASESITTLEGIPNAPSIISAIPIPESGAIEVQWNPPTEPKGFIMEYHLTIVNTVTSIATLISYSVSQEEQFLMQIKQVGNLSPATYSVSVSAQTGEGRGPDSASITVTLTEPPPLTTQQIAISSTSASSPTSSSNSIVTSSSSLLLMLSSSDFLSSSMAEVSVVLPTSSFMLYQSPSPSMNQTEPTSDLEVVLSIVVPIVGVVLVTVLVIVVVFCCICCRRLHRTKKGLYNISIVQSNADYELGIHGNVPLRKKPLPPSPPAPYASTPSAHYYSNAVIVEPPKADKERLLREDPKVAQRDALEEPEDDESGFTEFTPSVPIYAVVDKSAKKARRPPSEASTTGKASQTGKVPSSGSTSTINTTKQAAAKSQQTQPTFSEASSSKSPVKSPTKQSQPLTSAQAGQQKLGKQMQPGKQGKSAQQQGQLKKGQQQQQHPQGGKKGSTSKQATPEKQIQSRQGQTLAQGQAAKQGHAIKQSQAKPGQAMKQGQAVKQGQPIKQDQGTKQGQTAKQGQPRKQVQPVVMQGQPARQGQPVRQGQISKQGQPPARNQPKQAQASRHSSQQDQKKRSSFLGLFGKSDSNLTPNPKAGGGAPSRRSRESDRKNLLDDDDDNEHGFSAQMY